jgi:hypothetical protein
MFPVSYIKIAFILKDLNSAKIIGLNFHDFVKVQSTQQYPHLLPQILIFLNSGITLIDINVGP